MGIKFRQQSLLSGKMHISSAAGPEGFALLTDHVLEITVSACSKHLAVNRVR